MAPPCGRLHKSKDVTLWRQCGINLVINTEREGFPRSAYLMHGASACDVGLRVEDAKATLARVRAMGAAPLELPVGPSELSSPAIRCVGGGVIHFIDGKSDLARVWEIEFDRVTDESGVVDGV